MTARKQSETAVILRAGRSKPAAHNSAAKATAKGKATGEKKRERIMINVPVDMVEPIKAAAEAQLISMSMYFVYAAKEKLERDAEE
jgi:hypothetical protein